MIEARKQAEDKARKRGNSKLSLPSLQEIPGSYWSKLSFAWSRIPNSQLLGLTSRLMIGNEADYLRWIEIYGQFDRSVFDTQYISTEDETTKKSTRVVLTESTAGLGTSGRFDLGENTWIRAGAYFNYRQKNVTSAGRIPSDFNFQNLKESNLLGLLLTGGVKSVSGPMLSGVDLELEALVPKFGGYRRLAAEVSSLFLLTRSPSDGESDAKRRERALDFRIGPLLRGDFLFIDKTFGASAAQSETISTSTKVKIINFLAGISTYVAL